MAKKNIQRKVIKNPNIIYVLLFILIILTLIVLIILSPKKENNFIDTQQRKTVDRIHSNQVAKDPVDMKLLNLQKIIRDEKNKATLSIKKAYLTPTLVENYAQYGNKLQGMAYLILEVDIRDTRLEGNPREISFQNYFRLRKDSKDIVPAGYLYSWLPQEDKTIYVIFPLTKEEKIFNLLLGPFTRASLYTIDFTQAETITGVFNGLDGGFSEKFIEGSRLFHAY